MGCSNGKPVMNSNMKSQSLSDEGMYDDYQDSDTNSDAESEVKHKVHWDDASLDELKSNFTSTTRLQSARGARRSSRLSEFGSRTMTNSTSISSEDLLGGTRAPSLSLWYDDNVPGDILVQDVYVPSIGLTKHTYYCCLQWNSGKNGGGYCGMQDHSDGRNYIFSIWDPVGSSEQIKPVYLGNGTVCEPFEDAGTGLKSWNFKVGWEPDRWYTFVTRRWDQEGHTFYGLWVKEQLTGVWSHIVTIDFPIPNIYFDTWTCSFLEDSAGSGHKERRVHFKNGYKRRHDGNWIPFDRAVFGLAKEKSCQLYEDNYDTGTFESTFYLQSGGQTFPSEETEEGMLYRAMDEKPDTLPPVCYLTTVAPDGMRWEIPEENVPQYAYTVYVDNELQDHAIDSEARKCEFSTLPTECVELVVEDIYGRFVRVRYLIKEGHELAKRRTVSGRYSVRLSRLS